MGVPGFEDLKNYVSYKIECAIYGNSNANLKGQTAVHL